MPTIAFSLKDLDKLVGAKLTIDKLEELVDFAKGEIKSVDKDEVQVNFDDTNLPYLWSVEGFARLLKGILQKETGLPKLKAKKGNFKILVDKNMHKVRPYIAAFVVKGKKGIKVDDYLIKQLIQLQEKFCINYGKKREKAAVGIYSFNKIKFPVSYKLGDPEKAKFVPLDFKREMTLSEILEVHPKGQEYKWILEGHKRYPLLVDSKGEVLSFPPIINSNFSGKVEEGDSDLFFEVTGTDLNTVLLAANIFAFAFMDRGFDIYSVTVQYPSTNMTTPKPFNQKMKLNAKLVEDILGLKLKESEIKKLLARARFDYNKGVVKIPDYRWDILHPVDLVEEVGIIYGFNNIPEQSVPPSTSGEELPIVGFVDKFREVMIGLGYQEIMSGMLTNKNLLYDKMNIEDFGTVEIKEYMSELYSAVRTWILPQLMSVLQKNKHVEYPQKIFEAGLITKKSDLKDYERLAVVCAHKDADFTEIKQVLEALFRATGFSYELKDVKHGSFIEGRVGRVIVNDKKVGFIGEIHPQVLENFNLEVPVIALELNLTDLFEVK